MADRNSVTKFFVSNLPEGCNPWDLRKALEGFGDLVGTFVAKKQDKNGCRFGFASFKDVKDRHDLEKMLRGVKMGDYKLKINIARFAVENAGFLDHPEVKAQGPKVAGNAEGLRSFKFRDFRSYSDVLGMGSSKGGGGVNCATEGSAEGEVSKSIVAPDRTEAFSDLYDIAVIGRTVNLETLVDFDKLMRIAKVDFSRIQYLGGLTILISFLDKSAARRFLDAKNLWEPWFTKLEAWRGQSLHLERVAWLKLSGIPLHLLDTDFLSQIGALFGKVLHVPKGLEEEQDLSVCRVGILAGEANRINEVVKVKWKNRLFRTWVEEELDDWIPDCLGVPIRAFSDISSPMASSPVIGNSFAGNKEPEGSQQEFEGAGGGGVSVNDAGDSHDVEVPMHEDRENVGAGENVVGEGVSDGVEGNPKGVDSVGPGLFRNGNHMYYSHATEGNVSCHEVGNAAGNFDSRDMAGGIFPFSSVSGDGIRNRKKPFNIAKDKHKGKPIVVSPDSHSRPKKRSRLDLEESYESYGVLGRPKVDKSKEARLLGKEVEDNDRRQLDLNKCGSESGGGEQCGADNSPELQPKGNGTEEVSVALEDEGSEILKEIDATVFLGNCVGVNLRNHGSLVEEAIRSEGNNAVIP
ncbi:putative RNA recognition motif domain, nucleotide-binding alpha-beta plait domain superfamily [Helianthus annuus]|nr:putative RNA recognition motif domain, nucleotide-binding alpha-beta plait domain superfamily [Helianthus annuus]